MNIQNNRTTIIHRYSVRTGHVDTYLDIWRQEAELRKSHGFEILFANIEPVPYYMLSWGYSYDGDIDAAEKRFLEDSRTIEIKNRSKPFVHINDTFRLVRQEMIPKKATPESVNAPLTLYRRYGIKKGAWDEFLELWHKIVMMREKYGFKVLYAFSDLEENIFTWSFSLDGDLDEVQSRYYKDPDRVELEKIYDSMIDLNVKPVRQLLVP
jgi:hypothetical protein